jgi:hypothetical protein
MFFKQNRIKSSRLRRAEYLVDMREMKKAYKFLVGMPERRDNLEDLGVDRRLI